MTLPRPAIAPSHVVATEDPPRRGRPPARNEILRHERLGGVAPEELAARFGTPLYVYDRSVIDGQVAALRQALPPNTDLAYAVKANPALAVVAHLATLELGADVASTGELEAAVRAGMDPARIVVTGPGKRDDQLAAAVRAGVRAITVESLGELGRLEGIAASMGRRQPILLRAAVSEQARIERVRLVGDDGAGKFGMDATDLARAARIAAGSSAVSWLGVHAFGASNVLDAGALVAHVRATAILARELAADTGTTVRIVDAGGGLGIPYEAHEASLDLRRLERGLADLVAEWPHDPLMRDARLLLEPGRFLVGPAGAYVARVVDTKSVDGTAIAILDGGVHHVLRPALVGQDHRIRLLASGVGRPVPVTIAGPLCSGLDILGRGVVMPMPAVGDLLAVLDVGAYGFTESMPYFLSHPVPAEVIVADGRADLIRPRLEPTEWLDRQVVPVR